MLVAQLFCSTTRVSLSNFIITQYLESFMLQKKGAYNALSLELYTPFDFQPRK